MIIDDPRTGPQFCHGVISNSLPPGCAGVSLQGVDVRDIAGAQSAAGTTWVDRASVIGVYKDGAIQVERIGPPEAREPEKHDFSPGCPEPPGGWAPFNERTADDRRAREKLKEYERSQPQTYAGSWYHQATGVYTYLFTEDLEQHRAALNAILPGRICVAKRELNARMLTHISNRLHKGPSAAYLKKHDITVTGASVDWQKGRVELDVVIGGPARQRKLDERYAKYGEGVVVIRWALLRPV